MQIQKLKATNLIVLSLVGVVCASVLWAGQAWATKIISKSSAPAEQHSDTVAHTILAKSFKLRKRGRVAVFYSAECAVNSSQLTDRVVVQIFVDGVLLPVTGSRNFCSSNGGVVLDGFAMHAQSAWKTLSPGSHTVEIVSIGIGIGGSESYWIADQNVTLIAEKN